MIQFFIILIKDILDITILNLSFVQNCIKTDYKGNLRPNYNSVINGFISLLGFPVTPKQKESRFYNTRDVAVATVQSLGQKILEKSTAVFLPGKPLDTGARAIEHKKINRNSLSFSLKSYMYWFHKKQ